jgi:hypothetical protein
VVQQIGVQVELPRRDHVDDRHAHFLLTQSSTLGDKSTAIVEPVVICGVADLHGGDQLARSALIVDQNLMLVLVGKLLINKVFRKNPTANLDFRIDELR